VSAREAEVLLFDLDDTLHDDTYAYHTAAEEVAHEIAAERGIDALALKAAYIAEAEGFWTRLNAEALTTKMETLRATMWQSALQSVGIVDELLAHRSARQYNDYRKKHYALFPGVVELLDRLRARGKKLGIVTNGLSETHREKIALLRLTDRFDAIFLADEVGMVKPDPLLFAHACRTLGSAPAHSAMVGDRYDRDVRGALDAGLYTVWVNVRTEALPAGGPPPHAECTTIEQIARVLDAL
jgi:putative hydrolase of the HAD superfamily